MGGRYVYDCDWCGLKDIPETPLEDPQGYNVNLVKRGFTLELYQFKILKQSYTFNGGEHYTTRPPSESLCDGCAEQVRQLKKSIKEKRR